MAISINDISTGMGLVINDDVFMVTEVNHVKPGKGAAFVRVRLKSLKKDSVLERTFRASEKLEEAPLEDRRLQYLYNAGDSYHFMDQQNYEEMLISREDIGGSLKFLQENMEVVAICHHNKVQKVVLPMFVVTQIIETEPGFKGDSSRAGNKPAKIDTGALVQVPLFVNPGDWVKIDTRDGQYVERVQK